MLLVGDTALLPSIGPGRVLGDIVAAGVVPVTELTTLHRDSPLPRLAAAVRTGELPRVDDPTREVVVVVASSAEEAAHRVVQLVTDSIPRALSIPADEVQVLTPGYRGPAGAAALDGAMTVQRSVGLRWPAVVVVLPGDATGRLSRPLVYTAFTRAQRHLSVVHAAGPALARAVRLVGARPRRTRLAALLRAE